jgi:putative DNA primase/helicase
VSHELAPLGTWSPPSGFDTSERFFETSGHGHVDGAAADLGDVQQDDVPLRSGADVRERVHHRRHLTDLGNSERLVSDQAGQIIHVTGIGWHAWDGRRFRRDSDGEIVRRAKHTIRDIYTEAATVHDDAQRKALIHHATRSEAEPRLRAMVSLAESDAACAVHPDTLDPDAMKLNVLNGVINLRTGDVHPHRLEDLITKLAPVEYQPEATHPTWEKVIRDATGGDIQLERFLQRVAGYCLTGSTAEEMVFFLHGPTATCKSTVTEGLKAMLGDYAVTADFETFLKRRGDQGIRNDVARLAGARMVLSLEVDEGKQLAEGLIKTIVGGDTVTARFLYREAFEYTPRFKLILVANTRPQVNAADAAIWRRIVQIPFINQIPESDRDPKIKAAVKHDPDVQQAILAWAVQGCRNYQADGLQTPDVVIDYTAEYRAENDPIRDWIDDKCVVSVDVTAFASDLRDSYAKWADANGARTISDNLWSTALKARNCVPTKVKGRRAWRGIGIKP